MLHEHLEIPRDDAVGHGRQADVILRFGEAAGVEVLDAAELAGDQHLLGGVYLGAASSDV